MAAGHEMKARFDRLPADCRAGLERATKRFAPPRRDRSWARSCRAASYS